MAEQPNLPNEADLLQQALAELEEAIKPLEENILSGSNLDNADLTYYVAYLYMLWAEFHIYILEPFAGGESGSSDGTAKIIPLDNGRKIFDYGYALSTSVGEDYSSYCQGKLYETIQEMIAILAKRGAKKISLIGHSLAMRVAWVECVEHQIEIANYEPSDMDFRIRERLRTIKEKAKKLKPGQELRL